MTCSQPLGQVVLPATHMYYSRPLLYWLVYHCMTVVRVVCVQCTNAQIIVLFTSDVVLTFSLTLGAGALLCEECEVKGDVTIGGCSGTYSGETLGNTIRYGELSD